MREEIIMKRKDSKKRRRKQEAEIEGRDFISIITRTLYVTNIRHQSLSIKTANVFVSAHHKFPCCDLMGLCTSQKQT
jgi:hypothetical protein